MKFDEPYLREMSNAVIAGDDVDWDKSTMGAHILKLLGDRDRLRALIKQAEWGPPRPVGESEDCPWCQGQCNRHFEDCPAFWPNGEVK